MKRFFTVLMLVVASLAVPAVASAANQTTTTTATPSETTDSEPENTTSIQIDGATRLVGFSYLDDRSLVRITLESDIPQTVVVADGGTRQGRVPTRKVVLRPGKPATVELPVTEYRGDVGFSISTQNGALYRVLVDPASTLIGGNWTYRDAQLVALVVGTGVCLVTIIMLLRSKWDLDESPERIA